MPVGRAQLKLSFKQEGRPVGRPWLLLGSTACGAGSAAALASCDEGAARSDHADDGDDQSHDGENSAAG